MHFDPNKDVHMLVFTVLLYLGVFLLFYGLGRLMAWDLDRRMACMIDRLTLARHPDLAPEILRRLDENSGAPHWMKRAWRRLFPSRREAQ